MKKNTIIAVLLTLLVMSFGFIKIKHDLYKWSPQHAEELRAKQTIPRYEIVTSTETFYAYELQSTRMDCVKFLTILGEVKMACGVYSVTELPENAPKTIPELDASK